MRKINDDEKKYLLSLKPDDITFELLEDLFSDTAEVIGDKVNVKKSKFVPSDTFTLEANEYFNKSKIETTVGLFIFNKFLIEEDRKSVV